MKIKTFNLIKWLFFPLFFFWCFPQNFLGFLIFIYSKLRGHCKRIKTDDEIVYFEVDNKNPCYGVSLGYWIFLREYCREERTTQHHEYGHQIQSLILGVFYLLLIGLPSGLSNLLKTYKTEKEYYNYPWESWADKLAKIKHKNLSYIRELEK